MHLLLFPTIVFFMSTVCCQKMENLWKEDTESSRMDDLYIQHRFTGSTVTCGYSIYQPSNDYSHVKSELNDTVIIKSADNDTVIIKSLVDKIVGGTEARQGEIPWQARVTPDIDEPSGYDCGAVIINEFWLLSAAHCFYETLAWERRVTVGKHHLYQHEPGEQQFEVDRIYQHEKYIRATKDFDIAIIKIKPSSDGRGIQFNKFVQPVCLPDSSTSLSAGTKLIVSGWGWAKSCTHCDESQNYTDVLRKAELLLTDQNKCKRLYKKRITDRMFCAGYTDRQIDACKGDSGGPVVYADKGYYTLYGIVSWGFGCAQNVPGVYTRVTSVLSWIEHIIHVNSRQPLQRLIPMMRQ